MVSYVLSKLYLTTASVTCAGQGLGKDKQGIREALKPAVKLNTHGLGHDASKEFTFNWWEHVYDTAVQNVNVEETKVRTYT